MSKPQTEEKPEKVIINYTDAPILEELDFPDLVKDFRKYHVKEKAAETEASGWKKKKQSIGESIQTAVETANADTVLYNSGRKEYKATVVKDDNDSTKTDEDLLRENLMKIGKLDARLVARIFAESQVPAPRKGYVLVTVKGE